MKEIMESIIKFLLSSKFYAPIIYIVIGIIAYKLITRVISRLLKLKKGGNNKKQQTVIDLLKNIIKYIIIIIVVLSIMEKYGVDTSNIIASLGILGVVVGLACQDTLKNMLAGIMIILENRYNIGDTVQINTFVGEVLLLGLQTTKLRNATGEIFTINNSAITSVINFTESDDILYINLNVNSDTDIKNLEKVLTKLIPKVNKIKNVKKEMILLGVESFTASELIYRLQISCKSNTHGEVKRELNKLFKETFEKEGIQIKSIN